MDTDLARLLNTLLVVGFAVGLLIALVRALRPGSGISRAYRWGERVELPLTETLARRGIAARFRTAAIAEAVAGLIAVGIAALFLLSPLADGALFLIVVMFPLILVTLPLATVGVSLRERLFAPAPDAVRVARIRTMRTADYLGTARRATTWVMLALAVAVVVVLAWTWVQSPARVEASWARAALVLGVLALALAVALPRVERAILEQPQPASDALELAWDDSLRTGALSIVRQTVAMTSLVTVAAAVGALLRPGITDIPLLATQVIVWGQLALTLMYPNAGFRLRPGLRPGPAAAGSAVTP